MPSTHPFLMSCPLLSALNLDPNGFLAACDRHVHGPHLSRVLWSMCSFYFMVSCHLKAYKVRETTNPCYCACS
jgi:hypothetical protein